MSKKSGKKGILQIKAVHKSGRDVFDIYGRLEKQKILLDKISKICKRYKS